MASERSKRWWKSTHQSPFLPTPSRTCALSSNSLLSRSWELNAPLAGASAALPVPLDQLVDPLWEMERAVGRRFGGARPVGAKAGFHGRPRALHDAHAGAHAGNDAAGGIALAEIPHHPAQQGMDRPAEHLALDVPQRQVERADGVNLLAPRRIEKRARHVLPQAFDILRILPDQAPGGL